MLKFSANLSTLFQELPLVERVAAAAHERFDAVEVWFPYECPAHEFRHRLDDNGVECVMMNTLPGDVARGDWGLAVDASRRSEFIASVDIGLDYASAIGCKRLHLMSGSIPEGIPLVQAQEDFARSVADAADRAKPHGISILIEPLNRIDRPNFLLTTQLQAIELIQRLERENLGLMLDIYHVQRGEGNLLERVAQSLPYALHVQFADVPGRHEPGTGEINFPHVFAELARLGWASWVGCEFFPSKGTDSALAWKREFDAKAVPSVETT